MALGLSCKSIRNQTISVMKTISILLVSALMIVAGCNSSSQPEEQANQDALEGSNRGQAFVESDGFDKNVLEVASSNEDFSTLTTAVQAAGVENALVNAGPLTVFAPNNTAFTKLPEGTVEDLLKEENKSKLAYILTNHVAPANYPAKTLKKLAEKGSKLYMASGEYVEVRMEGEDIYVGGTKILATVDVSNGLIHVIEDIILPEN